MFQTDLRGPIEMNSTATALLIPSTTSPLSHTTLRLIRFSKAQASFPGGSCRRRSSLTFAKPSSSAPLEATFKGRATVDPAPQPQPQPQPTSSSSASGAVPAAAAVGEEGGPASSAPAPPPHGPASEHQAQEEEEEEEEEQPSSAEVATTINSMYSSAASNNNNLATAAGAGGAPPASSDQFGHQGFSPLVNNGSGPSSMEIDGSRRPRSRSRRRPVRGPPPPKTTLAAVLMLVGGMILLFAGLGVRYNTNPKDNERGLALIILGAILFIPGSYASTQLFGAYIGWPGYDYSYVPSYDD